MRFGSMSFQVSPQMAGGEGLRELSKDLYLKLQEQDKTKKSKRSELSHLLKKQSIGDSENNIKPGSAFEPY